MPTPPNAARLLWLGLLLVLVGCATPVGVDRVDPRELRRELTSSILTSSKPSARSGQLLDRLDLVEAFEDEPAPALEEIRLGLGGHDHEERLLALAELSFGHAEATDDPAWYRASALYAYAFLFPGDGGPGPNAFDPGLRLAAELYNRGLALGFSEQGGEDLDRLTGTWPIPFGSIEVSFDRTDLGWSGYRLRDLVPSSELRVRGLRNRYRRVGIGAPLAAGVERGEEVPSGHRVGERVRVPITAFLRIAEPGRAVATGRAVADLELYVLDQQKEVGVGNQRVPLEYEPTTALAFALENQAIWDFELSGFFGGDFNPFEAIEDGLVLLHPYRPGRVPVVLVHGTASSPGRWAEMVNELRGDPQIADRIQLWLFLYNTGNPILYSGRQLRRALRDTVEDLDPQGVDPALQRMVVAGHSQGGLLTKLQVVSSGNRFWEGISDRPFSELTMSDETRDLLESVLFFEALPFVRRVVYIATPHGGSYQARRRIAGWISGLIQLPLDLSGRMLDVLRSNDDAMLRRRLERMPTSLDNMTPGHPFLEGLASLSEAPGVSVHSIVAVDGEGPPERLTDGVVAYTSAHIPSAASELVVRSRHSVQGNPRTISEMKRILFEHFEQLDAAIEAGAGEPAGGR